jgi:hypothetical protein
MTTKSDRAEIVHVIPEPAKRSEEIPAGSDPDAPAVGKWYWVKPEASEDGEPEPARLSCVVHVGSNYAEFRAAGSRNYVERIHLNDFWERCTPERNPDAVIAGEIRSRQTKVMGLMKKAQELTARLAITPGLALPGADQPSETQALALRGNDQPVEEYKAALVKAKDETLPEIFKEIENTNHALACWMKSSLIPLEAQARAMEPVIGKIKERIFSVELYAGLTEQVEQVRKGDPAPLETKVHLLQRRHYMDEECLANYQTGGMDFKGIRGFDRWLGKKENLERILPFPRCIVAFQVRRHGKHREWHNVAEFFKIADEAQLDKMTFLYVRNGGQLFRLSTEIDFGAQLFPDLSEDMLGGKLYAKVRSGDVGDIITEAQYLGMVEEEERKIREAREKLRTCKKEDRWKYQSEADGHYFRESRYYEPFSPESVYHDDILKELQDKMNRHNRLVLVLQGLLDRSPVLHPHPPWSLWNAASFRAALELVYDDSRALTPGDAPDFEAYRSRLNESLRAGSVTIGQDDAWARAEARKENKRLDEDHRTRRSDFRHKHYRPYGNPGPGVLARVHQYQPKAGKVTYAWNRERQTRGDDGPTEIRCTFSCDTRKVLNVDAYKPGDFKIFFSDPRTRADYLKWAPLLLEAEEYHAGNRKVAEVPPAPKPKAPTWEGQRRYAWRKQRKELMGKAVRLTRNVTMKSGTVYKAGSLWRVVDGKGRELSVRGIKDDGTWEPHVDGHTRWVTNLDFEEVTPASDIPDLPKKEPAERDVYDDLEDEYDEDDD